MPDRYFVYVLQSEATGRYYIGQTNNLEDRLQRHNAGRTRSGRRGGPWRLVYQEEFCGRAGAMRRERVVKAWKSRKYLERLSHEGQTSTRGGDRLAVPGDEPIE